MEEFFSNPWVTGIGGGLISGIIVYFLTTFIAERRQNKEYKQKVSSANRDVVYLIRTCIPEKITPSKVLINMLIDSVSRKYSVRRDDMLTVKQIYSDISMEIMDSYFISAERKVELCKMIVENIDSDDDFKNFDIKNFSYIYSINDNKSIDIKIKSLLFATIAFAASFLVLFSLTKNELIEVFFHTSIFKLIGTFYIMLVSLLAMLASIYIYKKRKHKTKNPT